ncbi:hypothetical protein I4I73_20515 [Pseudonocardia sp. KRD-184]|uniref:Uncharacterized protein n=1 Tax=Pseudonocardia oceani TaxID=2792013 RepID=A0ABS6U3B2_9PSEU|nr:hypothetical protein [Pseudonocardia oceani]MBW0091268.1 hypothetical protein [Pseudonocardia oceani]MBW0098373.1 hypothetical protein [Pseudonocardia oceani]MBW0110844.1 hypothetical protein [Pseudonocardia oceani]MBW0119771.1 hypothetical protein [Pseudonocardia oceani]MBW0126713.1 hypothetical protein [Pseudonocardia oceani]
MSARTAAPVAAALAAVAVAARRRGGAGPTVVLGTAALLRPARPLPRRPGRRRTVPTWQTVHLLSHRPGGATDVLVVAVDTGTIGGCAVGPDGPTPLRTWRVGPVSDGTRPLT